MFPYCGRWPIFPEDRLFCSFLTGEELYDNSSWLFVSDFMGFSKRNRDVVGEEFKRVPVVPETGVRNVFLNRLLKSIPPQRDIIHTFFSCYQPRYFQVYLFAF